jgi:peptidyl-prolyl cis-trans isomerase C
VGVLALAAAGGFFFTQNQGGPSATTLSAAETAGVEDIAPAAGKKEEKKAEEKTAETPAEAAPAAIGDIKMGDPVVAKMGSEEIKRSDVFAYISTLPEQVRQMPLQDLFPLALDQVLNNKIIGKKAEQAKLETDPEVTKLLDQAKGQIVRNVYIERELTKAISQKELLKAYEKALEGFQKVDEVHARHILLKDEAAAQEVIKKLDAGTPFEELAKESTDSQTAVNGGDLGFFAKDQMIPEFSEAAFALEPGSYTKTPVKTQFGYHVIKVEEKRQRPEPQFEAVKPQLEAQVRREKLNSMLEGWQKEASIKKFDINGDPVSAEPKKN